MKKQMRIFSIFAALVAVVWSAFAAAPVNPRTSGDRTTSGRESTVGALTRSARRSTARTRVAVRPRSAASVLSRAVSPARVPAGMARSANVSRAASVVRTAAPGLRTNGRATAKSTSVSSAGLSRSAMARATAIFNDVSKIGSGYAECRESYSTCMDQMCANANDTYRRCFCSERFQSIRDTENRLDQAMLMLQQFQDNNLNAVDKSAAEVSAMYTATVGEQEIKKDTSASAKLLNNIDRLLGGASIETDQPSNSSGSLGVLDLDFSVSDGDIWGNSSSSIFDTTETDMSTLEGRALFNAAQNQCVRLTKKNCENDAVFDMTKSSYNILITQDCNAYEKTLSKKRETLTQAVRTAEKYLREARLEEYRTHNSADVNECLSKVRTTMLSETACGADYARCLDPTGAYIDSTGEPIYTARLFKLEEQMQLNGTSSDVLSQNASYSTFLDTYRQYVERDLDTCRDKADFVWNEFKRMAVIEIAQAQSALLEEVRESCVETIAECYDTQSNALKSLADGDNSKKIGVTAGALGRFTARTQCKEKVQACALLWAPNSNTGNNACTFDGRGHITDGDRCGLTALLEYIDTVDSLNIAEKCGKAIDQYLTELCTPDVDGYEYPYNCKSLQRATVDASGKYSGGLYDTIEKFANDNCRVDSSANDEYAYSARYTEAINTAYRNLESAMLYMFKTECEDVSGMWYDARQDPPTGENPSTAFYTKIFGRDSSSSATWGTCYESSDRNKCLGYNVPGEEEITSWNQATEQCTFTADWYKQQCEMIGGYYENAMCYILD